MKSRLAILSMLVAGMLMSTTGAGLAVTSVSGNAAGTQYHHGGGAPGGTQGAGHNGGNGGTLGEGAQGGPKTTTPSAPTTTTTTTTATTTAVQPTRQLETGAGSGQLPFTGFLAIPVLLGGLLLLTAGLVLRRRAAR